MRWGLAALTSLACACHEGAGEAPASARASTSGDSAGVPEPALAEHLAPERAGELVEPALAYPSPPESDRANLLAHTDLFRAGIARSGAYNRSLTPFRWFDLHVKGPAPAPGVSAK